MQSSPQNSFSPDVVNTLLNPRLLCSIRALLYSNNEQNKQTFFRVLLESTLIVLTTEAPKTPEKSILKVTEDGYNMYDLDTQISLVQLNSNNGSLILPIFTETKFIHMAHGLEGYHGLALSAQDILEMALIAGSESLVINPGSPEFIALDRTLIQELVEELKFNAHLPAEDSLRLVSHSI